MALVTIKCDTVWKYYDHVNKLWHVLPNKDEEGNLLPSNVMSSNFKDVTAQGFAVVKFYFIKDRLDHPVGWSAIQHNNMRNLPEDFDYLNEENVIIQNNYNNNNNKSQQRFTPQSLQAKAQTYEPSEAPF